MKKIYCTPKLNVVTISQSDLIATSGDSIGYSTGAADESEQLSPERGNPIWD